MVASADPIQAKVDDLAKLSPLGYEQVRESEAESLGVRVTVLDKEVARARYTDAEEAANKVVEELSPWDEPVSGETLLNELVTRINNHVISKNGAANAAAVWALGSFCLDAFRIFPKLQIKSPERRCGKSTLIEVLEGITSRPMVTNSISAAAVFRSIEEWQPTLLIDEADTFAKDNDELNGIINAGHTRRTAFVTRVEKVGDVLVPRRFSVWCPQVISGISDQRDTLEDRSITIELKRKTKDENVKKIPFDYFEENVVLRRMCIRWAVDNLESLKNIEVAVPNNGNDRAEDNWLSLVAIAELAGGEWPAKILSSYETIEGNGWESVDSAGVMLLTDIRSIFDEMERTRIYSEELVAELISLEDRPWCEWRRGNPMTKNSLARLLKSYKIKSKQIRIGSMNRYGYELSSFQDAFNRYLPCTSPQPSCYNATIQ